MRKKIYDIIEVADGTNRLSRIYDYAMIFIILLSIIPMAFKGELPAFYLIEKIAVIIFMIDYLLRLWTADYKYPKSGKMAFLRYPFSFMAIIDLLSIMPFFTTANAGFKLLRIIRMNRALRVLRILKAIRYSKSFTIIAGVLRTSKDSLLAVGALAVGYVLISALIVFNVEPESFNNFFDAFYWATVSLTTVGYGDIYPITTIGRIVTMVSSMFGIAIVALPAGIITAGYMNELEKREDEKTSEEIGKENK